MGELLLLADWNPKNCQLGELDLYQQMPNYFYVFDHIKTKKIHSKDAKGDPNKYKMEIQTSLEVNLNNSEADQKDFIVSEIYDDFDSQFELNKY